MAWGRWKRFVEKHRKKQKEKPDLWTDRYKQHLNLQDENPITSGVYEQDET
jgi:hypothetical protein